MSKTNSGLTAATTPLTGTEVVYLIQGGNSRKGTTASFYIPGGTDVAVLDGGTGASTASGARTNLGLVIGTDVQAYSANLTSWSALTRAAGADTFFTTPTSANLRALLTDEVGTGAAYFVGGALGTPASGSLANMTGLPIAGGGTGQTTAAAAFDALAPTTTRGDLIFRNATTNARLAASTAGYMLQTNGAGTDPTYAGFLQAGTGAVTRTWQGKGRDLISVKDFGAVGDGVTNDASAIQAAVSALLAAGGGLLYFPGSTGDYICNSTVTIDATLAAGRYGAAITFYGDGPSRSCIKSTTISTYMFRYVGDLAHNESHFRMENIRLAGNVGGAIVAGSIGLSISAAAWTTFDRCDIEGFDAGISAADIDQVAFYNCNIRFNLRGIVCTTGVPITSPNSWTFVNALIAGNSTYGIYVKNANAFTFLGGSVQYNGRIGVAGGWGVYLDEVGDGYGNALFAGTAFEGNAGLGDFVSSQTTNPAVVTFDSVGFTRTGNATITTVTGAANNGSGLIRLAVASSASFVTGTILFVSGVGGVTNANGQWTVTVIDGTHIDLQGSTFASVYTSGGIATYYGYGTNQIYADGTNSGAVYKITGCLFRSFAPYVANAARPSIALVNTNAKISDDGTNYFQNATEKLTYPEAQRIGDDGTGWTAFTPAISAAGGTFTATAVGRYRRTGKRVDFSLKLTTTAYTATPTAPLTATLPLPAAADTSVSAINMTTTDGTSGIIGATLSTVRVWRGGIFPITANSQVMAISGTYETT